MLRMSLRDRIPNEEARRRTEVVIVRIISQKCRWAGHVARCIKATNGQRQFWSVDLEQTNVIREGHRPDEQTNSTERQRIGSQQLKIEKNGSVLRRPMFNSE